MRVANENYLVRDTDGRKSVGNGNAVGVKDDGDVKGLVVHAVRLIERGDAKQFGIVLDGGMDGAEVCVGELVQQRAVGLTFLCAFLWRKAEKVGAFLCQLLNLASGPALCESLHQILAEGVCVPRIFRKPLAFARFEVLLQHRHLHVRVEQVPVVVPVADFVEPLVDN